MLSHSKYDESPADNIVSREMLFAINFILHFESRSSWKVIYGSYTINNASNWLYRTITKLVFEEEKCFIRFYPDKLLDGITKILPFIKLSVLVTQYVFNDEKITYISSTTEIAYW